MKKIILLIILQLTTPHISRAMICLVPKKSTQAKSHRKQQQITKCMEHIERNDIKALEKQLKKGVPLNHPCIEYDLVTKAVSHGNEKILRLLLAAPHADVNLHGALHNALQKGHMSFIPIMLNHKTRQINLLYKNTTLLHLAIIKGHRNIIELLLNEPDIDPNIKTLHGNTALHYACVIGDTETISQLINKNAQLLATNQNNITPLASAFIVGTINKIDSASLQSMLRARDSKNNTQLHLFAITKMYIPFHDYVELLKNNVNVWSKNNDGYTAFTCAYRRYKKLCYSLTDVQIAQSGPCTPNISPVMEYLIKEAALKKILQSQLRITLCLLETTNKAIEYCLFADIVPVQDIRLRVMMYHYLLNEKIKSHLISMLYEKYKKMISLQ